MRNVERDAAGCGGTREIGRVTEAEANAPINRPRVHATTVLAVVRDGRIAIVRIATRCYRLQSPVVRNCCRNETDCVGKKEM